MNEIVPLISSSVVGPLGIAHLPRLWLKILLHAAGRLPEGYRHGNGGFDEKLCERLGIDRDAFVAYIETERPAYLAVETWVTAHATALTPPAIAAWNRVVAGARLPDAMTQERHERFRLTEADSVLGVGLNDLDDWDMLHASLAR
ncbi:MAG: hypothetical protein NVS3B16_20590 [Vulcanimicrobiaceae bacterium]